jgi:2-polyprenyl-3-methyl-5-hydroxy-6-metoxy-1,4-benzoquinol methylase
MGEVIELSQIPFRAFENESYYDQATESHFWCRGRFEVLCSLLRKNNIDLSSQLRGFDIGCGQGVFRSQLENVTPWIVDAADIIRKPLTEHFHKRGVTYLYNIHDQHPKFENFYDIVFLMDVIEHIEDPEKFLSSVAFHLKKNGLLAVNVPALNWLWSRFDAAQGHFRRYSIGNLQRTLEIAGYSILDIRYWGMSMVPLLSIRKLLANKAKSDEEVLRSGFTPPSPALNAALYSCLKLENSLMKAPPFGTSVMAVCRLR